MRASNACWIRLDNQAVPKRVTFFANLYPCGIDAGTGWRYSLGQIHHLGTLANTVRFDDIRCSVCAGLRHAKISSNSLPLIHPTESNPTERLPEGAVMEVV